MHKMLSDYCASKMVLPRDQLHPLNKQFVLEKVNKTMDKTTEYDDLLLLYGKLY